MQVVLLLGLTGLVAYLLASRNRARVQAGAKLGFALFVAVAAGAVLRPDDLTRMADLLGIGRGTDLLLYVLVIVFAFATVVTYIRFRRVELLLTKVVRALAIEEAERREGHTPDDGEPEVGPGT